MDGLFPARLKRLRIKTGKTQEEVATLLNIKRSTYGEYERGKITPPIDKLEQMAKIVGTTPQYLLGWNDRRDLEPKEPSIATNFFDVDEQLLPTVNLDHEGYEYTMRMLKRAELWDSEISKIRFTDVEFNELMNYAKYLIFKRESEHHGRICDVFEEEPS